jgi:hypothetical protein
MTYSFKEKVGFLGIFFILLPLMYIASPTENVLGAILVPSAILTGIIFVVYRRLKIERYERQKQELISATYRTGDHSVEVAPIRTPMLGKPSVIEKFLDSIDNLISLTGSVLIGVPFIFGVGRLLLGAANWLKDGYWTSYTTCNVLGYFCHNSSKWSGVNIILNRFGDGDPTIFLLVCIPIGLGLKALVNVRSNSS